jgi:hypothetical protein
MWQTINRKKAQRKPNEEAITTMTDEDIARYDQLMRLIDGKPNPTRQNPAVGRAGDMEPYGEKMPNQEVTLMRFVTQQDTKSALPAYTDYPTVLRSSKAANAHHHNRTRKPLAPVTKIQNGILCHLNRAKINPKK